MSERGAISRATMTLAGLASLALASTGCLDASSDASGTLSGQWNLYHTGPVPPQIHADRIWCDWAAQNRHIVLHIRFRNSGAQAAKLRWTAGGGVSGIYADSAQGFNRTEATVIPPMTTVVVQTDIRTPKLVEPGAVLTSCEPRPFPGR